MSSRKGCALAMSRLRLVLIVAVVLCAVAIAPQGAFARTTSQRLATLEKTVSSLSKTVKSQKSKIASLSSRLSTVEHSSVMHLSPYVSLETTTINGLAGPHVIFTGVNLHVRSGAGQTDDANGLGNLIVGYDEMLASTETSRTGSHNLVVGHGNKFTSFGGFVGGWGNYISSPFASVLDGSFNTASGGNSSVTGGENNKATESCSSVGGGQGNTASGLFSAVSGGQGQTAATDYGWWGGGHQ